MTPDASPSNDSVQGAADRLCILGIDPGLADVGWGIIEHSPGARKTALVNYGVIRTPAGEPLARRLDQIYTGLTALIEHHRPTVACVEELFFARNAKTAMVVAHGRAACILATARRGLDLREYTPPQIKQALTGHGRAGKHQVQMMVRTVLGLHEAPKPDHAADALAAAICYVNSLGLEDKISAVRRAAGTQAAEPVDLTDPRKRLLAMRRVARRRR